MCESEKDAESMRSYWEERAIEAEKEYIRRMGELEMQKGIRPSFDYIRLFGEEPREKRKYKKKGRA